MNILFLDQSGKAGGAELCLLDIAKPYRHSCLIGLLEDGPFRTLLEQEQIPVQVLAQQAIQVRKESSFLQSLNSITQIVPLVQRVSQLSRRFDIIYANTPKALVVGAIASALSRRPLVYHLHDILSRDHFSLSNQKTIVTLANLFATAVIANSKASKAAFIAAGGRANCIDVIYNGFDAERYRFTEQNRIALRQELNVTDKFVIGHFSRLSPWKGQHILIEALLKCPEDVVALLVGDALFGEQEYVSQIHQQVANLGLQNRVQFLGFRSDVPQLMAACNLVTHTSTAPEPFGRVIVEAMLCGCPVIAAAAGGAIELIEPGKTGWLCPPGDPHKLAEIINICRSQPENMQAIAQHAQLSAKQAFSLDTIDQQIKIVLRRIADKSVKEQ
jgi:glycosyltransferase involved in cell wall biosynthesis